MHDQNGLDKNGVSKYPFRFLFASALQQFAETTTQACQPVSWM